MCEYCIGEWEESPDGDCFLHDEDCPLLQAQIGGIDTIIDHLHPELRKDAP